MDRVLRKLVPALVLLAAIPCCSAREEEVRFGRFGALHLYYPDDRATHVVLFVSGDGGWNQGVVDMARDLVNLDALVVGVDIRTYLKVLAASAEVCSGRTVSGSCKQQGTTRKP